MAQRLHFNCSLQEVKFCTKTSISLSGLQFYYQLISFQVCTSWHFHEFPLDNPARTSSTPNILLLALTSTLKADVSVLIKTFIWLCPSLAPFCVQLVQPFPVLSPRRKPAERGLLRSSLYPSIVISDLQLVPQ